MTYQAKIVLDSISRAGIRLVTMELEYPRFIHSELMTHRVFSRNASSSRARPVSKTIQSVLDDPVFPVEWGANQPGMQPTSSIEDTSLAEAIWDNARLMSASAAEYLNKLGVHKQIANRILEPYSWIRVLVTSTEWYNFFQLRCDSHAQAEMQKIAYMMRDAYHASIPVERAYHMPFITEDEWHVYGNWECLMMSAAKCARISYLTHDGKRDPNKDLELAQELFKNKHMSPFEHVAYDPFVKPPTWSGNLYGWIQFRKVLEDPLWQYAPFWTWQYEQQPQS